MFSIWIYFKMYFIPMMTKMNFHFFIVIITFQNGYFLFEYILKYNLLLWWQSWIFMYIIIIIIIKFKVTVFYWNILIHIIILLLHFKIAFFYFNIFFCNVFLWSKWLLKSSVSHDPSELILIFWFVVQNTLDMNKKFKITAFIWGKTFF